MFELTAELRVLLLFGAPAMPLGAQTFAPVIVDAGRPDTGNTPRRRCWGGIIAGALQGTPLT